MKALVIGTSGTIGGRLLAALTAEGIEVSGTTRQFLDLRDVPQDMVRQFGDFDVVYLCAAKTRFIDCEDDRDAYRVNVDAQVAIARQYPKAKIVYLSSEAVERALHTNYGMHKALAEASLRAVCDPVIVRLSKVEPWAIDAACAFLARLARAPGGVYHWSSQDKPTKLTEAAGYEIIRLKGGAVERLITRLQARMGLLESYFPDGDITAEQVEASKELHDLPEWREILADNAAAFRSVVGQDLLFQREPYLRIARPGRREDQIGIHRDTHYGASAHEWVLWIPLTDATEGAEMRILPGSHLKPESAYPWTQEQNTTCERGSDKHWLGFRYAPKRMSSEVEAQTIPVPCKVGSAILFNSNAVHGQAVNNAPWTRVSIDIRLVDAKAPIQAERGLHGSLYEPLRAAA